MQDIEININETDIDLFIDGALHKQRINENEIKMFKTRHICGGCQRLPTKGFKSRKYDWCQFSRLVARLQEYA